MKDKQAQLELGIRHAAVCHNHQFDKGGSPYILHCLEVMRKVRDKYPNDLELQTIAVMHDIIEDTGETEIDLFALGFSNRVIDGVTSLTKSDDEEYEEYIARLVGNPDAVAVKIADIEHNSDITRLKGLREKDFERMRKYHQTYVYLKEVYGYEQ